MDITRGGGGLLMPARMVCSTFFRIIRNMPGKKVIKLWPGEKCHKVPICGRGQWPFVFGFLDMGFPYLQVAPGSVHGTRLENSPLWDVPVVVLCRIFRQSSKLCKFIMNDFNF